MIFNKGDILKRPGESIYSQQRRFYIANPALEDKLKQCRSRSGNKAERDAALPNSDDGASQVFRYASSTCNGIVPIRNCRSCARLGYHSALYDFPWIALCPVHNEPLLTACPDCKKPWPSNFMRCQSKCKTCGTHLTMSELFERGAMKAPEQYMINEELLEDIYLMNSISYLFPLNALSANFSLYMHRRGIHPTDLVYPSLACHLNPSLRPKLEKYGIPHEPIRAVSARVTPTPGFDLSDEAFDYSLEHFLSPQQSWERTIRNVARRKIMRLLPHDSLDHTLSVICHISDSNVHNRYDHCPYCIIYSMWWHYISSNRKHVVPGRRKFRGYYFRCPSVWSDLTPITPEPLNYAIRWGETISGPYKTYSVPSKISKLVYYLDLLALFRCIYCNVMITKAAEDAHLEFNQFVQRRLNPFRGTYSGLCRDIAWFYDDDSITLYVPESAFNVSRPDISDYINFDEPYVPTRNMGNLEV